MTILVLVPNVYSDQLSELVKGLSFRAALLISEFAAGKSKWQ